MSSNRMRVLVTGVAALAIGIYAERGFSADKESGNRDPTDAAVSKGLKWLVSTQGKDGGWGQDGGETSYVRQGEHLESNGNDVANTAVVAEALLHTGSTATRGEYREPFERAVEFILKHVEQSPMDGLAVTDQHGTQIQRKLGPYIDTFMTAKLLAELDGAMGSAAANGRVRTDLQKCVAKIEKNQLKDGSWNVAGGWAPILGTSMASQGLAMAQMKGAVKSDVALHESRTIRCRLQRRRPHPWRESRRAESRVVFLAEHPEACWAESWAQRHRRRPEFRCTSRRKCWNNSAAQMRTARKTKCKSSRSPRNWEISSS